MADATSTFSSYDRSASDDSTLSTPQRRFTNGNTHSAPPRPGQHLDDADLLAWKRQYANIGLREQNIMSNSADDLSQLVDRIPYNFEVFGQDYNDMDDDELHFENGNNLDYEADIKARLKKANEELAHDETPVEIKHQQRVSFDARVKAVDIVRDPQEDDNTDLLVKPPVAPVNEKSSTNEISPPNGTDAPHEYTVPLNDTQQREGPTYLQQIKAFQFHGVLPAGGRWTTGNSNPSNDSSTVEEDFSSSKTTSNNTTDTQDTSDMTAKSSSSSQKSMLVSINGGFELQNEDDYTAKESSKQRQLKSNANNDDDKTPTKPIRVTYTPTPPTEPKRSQDPLKPEPSRRAFPSTTRPRSSESTSRSLSDSGHKSTTNNQPRAKSAGLSKSLQPFTMKPSSGVDFEALNRDYADRKREEQKKQRREKEKAEADRKALLDKAKASFEKWVHDKDSERKKLNEEKRMEKEEEEARQTQCDKELRELRERRYSEWVERKNHDVMIANEFRKLQQDEENEMASGGSSSSSIHRSNQRENQRAFNRWLRRKYEQSKEDQRQLRLESRRIRRRQRRSIKRFQLQQDLQLAKSFGYS